MLGRQRSEVDPVASTPFRSSHNQNSSGTNFAIFAVLLVVIRVVFALIALRTIGHDFHKGPFFSSRESSWIRLFNNWDATHYQEISQFGYHKFESRAFLPAYPLLIRSVSPIVGRLLGGLLIAWIGAVFAIWGVIDVARKYVSTSTALVSGALLAWNPVSVFLISGYPESLLVATMIWSLRFCLDRRWLPAALLAAFASCTMPQGVAASVVVVTAVVISESGRMRFLRAMFYGILGEAGSLGFLIYNGFATGNVLASQRAAQMGWHEHLTYPFHIALRLVAILINGHHQIQIESVFVINAIAGALGIASIGFAIYIAFRYKSLELPAVLLIVANLLSLSTIDGGSESTARFIFFTAPLYIFVAVGLEMFSQPVRRAVVGTVMLVCCSSAILFGLQFNLGWWFT